jgi:hypothetical protein
MDMSSHLFKANLQAALAAARANPDTETRKGLAQRFGISASALARNMRQTGVKLTSKQRFVTLYSVDETFFSVIDTPAKAQILGFIYADGCMSASVKAMSIGVAITDESYLQTINRIMGHTKPLYYVRRTTMVGPQTGCLHPAQDICTLALTRKRIYEDLINLGLRPGKTYLDLPLPPIPDHLIRWFILGMFEGDGSITYCKRRNTVITSWSLVGTPTILHQIAQHLERRLGIPHPNTIFKDGGTHVLRYGAQCNIQRLMDWLYAEHTGLRMERKYVKWMEICRVREETIRSWTPQQARQSARSLLALPPVPDL